MGHKVESVFAWIYANRGNIIATIVAVIGAASVLIKALEGVVKALVTFQPKLKTTDGKLLSIAAWLDALSKAGWLNHLAQSPAVAFLASLNPPNKDVQVHALDVPTAASDIRSQETLPPTTKVIT